MTAPRDRADFKCLFNGWLACFVTSRSRSILLVAVPCLSFRTSHRAKSHGCRYRDQGRAAQHCRVPALHLQCHRSRTGLSELKTPAAACARFRQRLWSRFFLGDLYAFKIGPARSPVAPECCLTFFCNLVRTAFLVGSAPEMASKPSKPGTDLLV